MITLKNLTMRNFLSTGNVCQTVNLNKPTLTLILGENLDLGGDGARNAVGKTTMLQAISYALYGSPINNIRKDNLVNRTNAKGMLVTIEFNVDGVDYKIERGRKPNVLRFYINNVKQASNEDDNAQGENKFTQSSIERVLNLTHEMFKQIIALNTYTEPFLALKNNEQREIIEQLLGITLLSEKAEALKELIKQNKDNIQSEEYKIKAIEEANKRVKEQIDSVRRRQALWNKKHNEDLENLSDTLEKLSLIDIDDEIKAHKELATWRERKAQEDNYQSVLSRINNWVKNHHDEIETLRDKLKTLSQIDFSLEFSLHEELNLWQKEKVNQDTIKSTISVLEKTIKKEKDEIQKLSDEISILNDNKCYACGQDFHDAQHESVLTKKQQLLEQVSIDLVKHTHELNTQFSLVKELTSMPITHYKSESEAIRVFSEIESINNLINEKERQQNPFTIQLAELENVTAGDKPNTYYKEETEAIEHRSKLNSLTKMIESKLAEVDPYSDQITEMENKALQEITFDKINELTTLLEHQKFLYDLLTSKDSFVRKKIIDQSLKFLNGRLAYYLDKIGLPHDVIFKNDLSVEITELGREMDFYNLSRGEMNRVILSLSWAFRDVWENLYSPINVLFVDELLDNGTDSIGMENSIAILKDMTRRRNKSIWLVSHKDELITRVNSVLKVVKEGGFTSYQPDVETT